LVLIDHNIRRATLRAAHQRHDGNIRSREGCFPGQLRQVASVGDENRIRLGLLM